MLQPPATPRRPHPGGGLGYLADGTPISPALARKLACDCDLIPAVPAVLGPDGPVLDLGRTAPVWLDPTGTPQRNHRHPPLRW